MLNLEAIAQRRRDLNLSMEQAAQASGGIVRSRQNWNDLEKGRIGNPTLETVCGMARALQSPLADIVTQDWKIKRKAK